MKIQVIAIGDKIEKWIEDGIKQYYKRMPSSIQLDIISTPYVKKNKGNINEKIKLEEHNLLFKNIKQNSFIICCDEQGENLSSEKLSKKIKYIQENHKNLVFLIGGANGHHDKTKKNSNYLLSLSKLTFPHSLARLILIEQIYRANSILNNHPYHK